MNDSSEACISLLEQILADAKAGNITTVGVVACGPGDFGAQIAGPDARSVYLGCGVLQNKIITAVTQPAVDMRPNIMRPDGGGAKIIRAPRPVPKG